MTPFPISRIPAVNVSKVPQRSPLRYPGGKTWLIPHIREWLSRSKPKVLIEPFAGGGIVSLTAVMEGLVDKCIMIEKDRDVAAFWRAVLQDGATLIEKVQQFNPTQAQVRKIEHGCICNDTEHGFRTLVLNRTRNSGILAPGASLIKNGENGKGIQSRWYPDTLASRINAIQKYSDRITFDEADAMQRLELLLRDWGRMGAVFLDPPYTAGGKRAGTRLYAHNDIDHPKLFEMLAHNSSDFLMTYDCAPEIVELVHYHRFSAVSVQMKTAHHDHVPELIITREPLFR